MADSRKTISKAQKSTASKSTSSRGSAPANQPKVLRIGIIQDGKIIEERIVRNRAPVFVGPSEKNDFVLPQEDVHTSRFCLFDTKGGTSPYVLNFQKEMGGKFSLSGSVIELAEAIENQKAQKKGKHYELKLDENSRGKVVLGNTTVLFQFVVPPPIQPKPQLPAAVKGSLFQGFELVITLTMTLSFLFHGGMLAYFNLNEWPEKTLEEKYRDLQELLNADSASFEQKKEEKDEGEGDEGDKAEEEVEEDKKPTKQKKAPEPKEDAASDKPAAVDQKSAEERAREMEAKRAALAQQMAEQGVNKILGALSDSGEGVVADVLSGGDVAADQDSLLAQVNGVGVSDGERSKLKGPAGGKGGNEAVDIGQVGVKGGDTNVKTSGPGPEKTIRGTLRKKAPRASGGTGMMNPADVAKVVGRRLGALKGCYERALKRDPSLGGKIIIRFTISGSGRVTTARAVQNQLGDSVGSCISSAFMRFRFPPPEGGTVTMEYPFLFTPAN